MQHRAMSERSGWLWVGSLAVAILESCQIVGLKKNGDMGQSQGRVMLALTAAWSHF